MDDFISMSDCWKTFCKSNRKILAYLLKARTVEPEKQPLLANGSEITFVSSQRLRNRQWNVRCYAADS
jgi:hypothetical protein